MAVTLPEFKKAFAGKASQDQYKARKNEVFAVIRETESFVKLLGPTDRAKEHALSVARLLKDIGEADKLSFKNRDWAMNALDKVKENAGTLRKAALEDAKKEFGELKKKADEAVSALEKSTHAGELKKDISGAKTNVAAAQKKADANQYEDAFKTLGLVLGDCTSAQIKAAARHGENPKKSDLEALSKLKGAKGGNRLDELVSSLPADTPQKFLKMALNVRFGFEVKTYQRKGDWEAGNAEVDDATPNKSLQRFYEVLLKVPESHSHADQNKSLKTVIHTVTDHQGAAYNKDDKIIKMYVSRGAGTGAEDYSEELSSGKTGRKNMFPDGRVDPYKPVNTKVKTPYFDWATLHEVGHSVDDKSNFMGSHSGSAYGDWVKETRDSVAAAAATKFSWDKAYIDAKLKDPTSTPVVPEAQQKMKDSDKIKAKIDNWCNLVVNGEPWFNGTNAKKIQEDIGGRVYQQSYPRDDAWWSYGWGERQKGIHGYQFRAPGEWFAELYAAFYSGKLQDKHPAVKWLKELEKPKKK